MAGTTALSNVLDSKELDSISPAVKYKLEVSLGSKVSELEDLKGKYEKLRVNSGESQNTAHVTFFDSHDTDTDS